MTQHLWYLIPEAILLVGVVAVSITGLFRNSSIRRLVPAVAGAFIAASATVWRFEARGRAGARSRRPSPSMSGSVQRPRLASSFCAASCARWSSSARAFASACFASIS